MTKRLLIATCSLPLAFAGQLQAGESPESVDSRVALEGSVLLGDDAVVQAGQALANGDPEDPLLRSRLAHAYFAANRDEDALPEYLWCLDQLEKRDAPRYAVEQARVLANLIRLAQRYEPAMDALVERRQAAENRLRNALPEPPDAIFVTSVNLGLEDEAATLALYEGVKGVNLPRLVLGILRREVLRILFDDKRYQEIAAEFDVAARAAKDFEDYEASMGFPIDRDDFEDRLDEWTREQWARIEAESGESAEVILRRAQAEELRRDIARWYEILIGTGELEQAAEIGARLVATLDDGNTRHALAWAGYRSGSPVEENLAYAQEAFDMTGGENLHVVDTLARLLASLKRRDEAIAIAQAGLEKAETTPERALMNDCLEYCRSRASDSTDRTAGKASRKRRR